MTAAVLPLQNNVKMKSFYGRFKPQYCNRNFCSFIKKQQNFCISCLFFWAVVFLLWLTPLTFYQCWWSCLEVGDRNVTLPISPLSCQFHSSIWNWSRHLHWHWNHYVWKTLLFLWMCRRHFYLPSNTFVALHTRISQTLQGNQGKLVSVQTLPPSGFICPNCPVQLPIMVKFPARTRRLNTFTVILLFHWFYNPNQCQHNFIKTDLLVIYNKYGCKITRPFLLLIA